jgi:hypothetical protein
MNTHINILFCDTDYTSDYQSAYGENILFYDETADDTSALDADIDELIDIENFVDYHDTSINQPSHPYNGDIMPMA